MVASTAVKIMKNVSSRIEMRTVFELLLIFDHLYHSPSRRPERANTHVASS